MRWYLRYSLSLRDVEELFAERGLPADHTTIWRWVQRYGPALEERLHGHRKPTNKSWRVDETYIRVQGRWCYLYRAIDSTGATIDFLLSALRDAAAAQRLFRQALSDPSHPQPRIINTDLTPGSRSFRLPGPENYARGESPVRALHFALRLQPITRGAQPRTALSGNPDETSADVFQLRESVHPQAPADAWREDLLPYLWDSRGAARCGCALAQAES